MTKLMRNTGRNSTIGVVPRLVCCAVMAWLAIPQASEAARSQNFLQAKMAIPAPSAARNLCEKYTWACSVSGATTPLTQDDIRLIRKINRRINSQIRHVSDAQNYRKTDYWTLPTMYRGDCEDIALLKKKTLLNAGIAPERLLIATVLDDNRLGHAVLILRTSSGDYVLDSLNNKIKPWKSTDYVFLRMQDPNAPSKWVGLIGQK